MRLRPLLHPVGPLPASVYWGRRLAVMALATAVAGTTAVAVAQTVPADGLTSVDAGVGPADRPSASAEGVPSKAAPGALAAPAPPAPEPPPEPAPAPEAADAEPVPCGPGELAVRTTADPLDGLAGVPIVLTVTLTAPGAACLVDLGPGAREAEVRSGPDRIWSTEDCEGGDDRDVVVLRPGSPRELTVTWGGRRSAPGCPDGLPEVAPGTYTVVVTVDGVESRPATFRLI